MKTISTPHPAPRTPQPATYLLHLLSAFSSPPSALRLCPALRSLPFALCLILVLSPLLPALSQIPQGFNYQAVARDGSGNLIVNQVIPVRITIQSSESGGTIYWQELHSNVTTNIFGLINLVVGTGVRQSASTVNTFNDIDWSQTPKYLKTELDRSGWINIGSSRLWSVPYSMSSGNLAGDLTKLKVSGESVSPDSALFEVMNASGQTVFAVYNEGVRIYVDDGEKGSKGGFAVGSFGDTKASSQEYLRVTGDSTRIYVNNLPDKGSKGGFAVSGFGTEKADAMPFFQIDQRNFFIGHEAGYLNETGVFNTFIGYKAGYSNISGDRNTFLGYFSGYSNTEGSRNIFIGDSSGYYNSTGRFNIFLGHEAGLKNTTGFQNILLGDWAGYANTSGNRNIFIGTTTGMENTTGIANVMIGNAAGRLNTTGSTNIIIGRAAGLNNTTGSDNIFMGHMAGMSSDTSFSNIYIGNHSGYKSNGGEGNVFLGNRTGYENTTGDNNTFLGHEAAHFNTEGFLNTAVGAYSGHNNTTGTSNTFVGTGAGMNNTTGNINVLVGYDAGANSNGTGNVFLGNAAGYHEDGSNKLYIENTPNDSTGALIYGEFENDILHLNAKVRIFGELRIFDASSNLFLGDSAGLANTGIQNTFIGTDAGFSNTSGYRNLFVGFEAGGLNTNGNNNTYIGRTSGRRMGSGSDNTFLGSSTGFYQTSGDRNVYVGRTAGLNNLDGSGNIFIGFGAGTDEAGSDRLYIENSAADQSNALVYGEFDNDYLRLNALTSVRDALILEPKATAPASPTKGMMYFDSNDNKLKVFDGTVWQSCW